MAWRPKAPVLVKTYVPRRVAGAPRRVHVVHYAASVEAALTWARARTWHGAVWIEAREWPAQLGVRPRAVYG